MAGKPQGWDQLPDSLLLKVGIKFDIRTNYRGIDNLQIMSHLDHASVGWSCSLTCKSWHRVSRDNILWRYLVNRDLLKQERSTGDLGKMLTVDSVEYSKKLVNM